MKKVYLVAGLLFALLLTSVNSFAQGTLFRGSSGDGWTVFEQDLQKENLIKNGAFPTSVLSQIAYAHAKSTNLPAGALGEKEFKTLFLLANNFSDTITVSEFRTLGQAGKIAMPDLVARTATVAEVPATPVAQAPVTPQVAPPDGRQAIAIAAMEEKVKALQADVAKSGNIGKEVAALAGKLAAVSAQLGKLQTGQAGFATTEQFEAQKAALATLQGEVNALSGLQSELDGVKANQSGIAGRLAAFEQSPLAMWWKEVLAALVAALLLLAWSVYTTWKKAGTAIATANTASEDVADLRTEVGALEIKIPENLEQQLKAMPENGETTVTIKVDDEAKVLRFTRVKDGVNIEGIESQPERIAVRIENVRKRIKKAAHTYDLLGVKNGVDAVNAQRLHVVG